MAVGWWAESHVSFGVTITPEVGFHYGGPKQEFGVTVTPEVGMAAVAHSRVGFGLSVPISLGMEAASHSKASFGLVFSPYIAMRGPAAFVPVFPAEDLYPSVSLFPTPRAQSPGFGLSFVPSFGFEAAPKFVRSFGIEVDPQVGMGTALGFTKGFGLELSPQIGMSGAERYYREFELTFAPAIGMDAEGNDGVDPVAFDASTAAAESLGSITFSHTAAAGADVYVVVSSDRSSSVTGVTCAGNAMTLVGTVSHNNSSSNGQLWIYRRSGAGTGSSLSITVSISGVAWYVAHAVSLLNVGSVGSLASTFGSGTSLSQSVTVPSGGLVLQAFATGGANGTSLTITSGATNRRNSATSGGAMATNTASSSGTVSATAAGSRPWSGLALPINPA
ncbi:minor tail protein [Mycobacterium phage Modragons]|uniref:Minor tail protein n=1 Tax=Mycobacterium phage Ochi17 TaxID=2502425 RepID=A0A411BTD5_9CAUD|nr:minor tail protein [Mycobacterium phage Llama]YP_010101034.1 minor tail protein [Mycobacterium phage Ochi17]AIM50962.1 minor tail protein [Mycobacterium phage Llama]QAY04874.1 minor tail protein [Mycobacterium phage Ochi17]QFP96404.1 minor tail protein [Mycobacterium phage Modragons]